MRRTAATLLVVASPLLVAVPVGAAGSPSPGSPAGAPVAVPAAAVPAFAVPAAPVSVAPPTVTAPAAVSAAGPATALAAAPVRPVARTLRHGTPGVADVDDAAYAARLQADLCLARTIFCGLDRSGHYPTR